MSTHSIHRILYVLPVLASCTSASSDSGDSTASTGSVASEGSTTEDPTASTTGTTDTTEVPTTGDTDTTGPGGCIDSSECTDAATPICSMGSCVACGEASEGGDTACEAKDPSRPACGESGECVQCSPTAASACTGSTPVCEGASCVGCTEHAQCEASACHLDGKLQGACFDTADVQMIADAGELSAALDGLASESTLVLVLTGSDYALSSPVELGAGEIAILGDGGQTISRNGDPVLTASGTAIVYFAQVAAANGSGSGLRCSGTSVWLDDTVVANNSGVGLDISGGCATHLRRTVVRGNNGGGIDVSGGELHMTTSAVGLNGNDLSSSLGGIQSNNSTVEISYSTIVGNQASNSARGSIFCAGGESGFLRNSIVVGAGSSIDGCSALAFENNAVDGPVVEGASNLDVGAASASWFSNLAMGDFRIALEGETVFTGIAQWVDGDPLLDVDGDTIPMSRPSFPGYDQPSL